MPLVSRKFKSIRKRNSRYSRKAPRRRSRRISGGAPGDRLPEIPQHTVQKPAKNGKWKFWKKTPKQKSTKKDKPKVWFSPFANRAPKLPSQSIPESDYSQTEVGVWGHPANNTSYYADPKNIRTTKNKHRNGPSLQPRRYNATRLHSILSEQQLSDSNNATGLYKKAQNEWPNNKAKSRELLKKYQERQQKKLHPPMFRQPTRSRVLILNSRSPTPTSNV
jgi:hypothetical protein